MVEKNLGSGSLKAQSLSKTKGRRRSLEAKRRIADVRERHCRNDLLPELRIQLIALDVLQPSPHRTRDTTAEQVERLVSSIASLGFNQPILIAGHEIIDGHIRVAAASALGLESVPAIDCSHLSPTEVRQLRLAANRTGELGTWNLEQLKIEFQELIDLDVDLSVTGFTSEEQDIVLLDTTELLAEDDEANDPGEAPLEPVARAGDIWVLDRHRVICGNALEPETYQALLAGEEVHALITDPPYNVPIKGNVSKTHDEFVMASGEMTDAEFRSSWIGFFPSPGRRWCPAPCCLCSWTGARFIGFTKPASRRACS